MRLVELTESVRTGVLTDWPRPKSYSPAPRSSFEKQSDNAVARVLWNGFLYDIMKHNDGYVMSLRGDVLAGQTKEILFGSDLMDYVIFDRESILDFFIRKLAKWIDVDAMLLKFLKLDLISVEDILSAKDRILPTLLRLVKTGSEMELRQVMKTIIFLRGIGVVWKELVTIEKSVQSELKLMK